ncbi:MAG: Smr/MutS family protein [Pseudomonadota bacterium]|nr:Smr/MutS family protein [Pseudomonadota bacterium]
MVKAKDGKSGIPGKLTDEDIVLWQRVTQGDHVLPGRDYFTTTQPSTSNELSLPKRVSKKIQLRGARTTIASAGRGLQGSGLDKRTATRLRRGQIPIGSRLDLHGLTQSEAKTFLAQALATAQERGQRCVLVITGKGLRREGGGVLKAKLPQWLAEPTIRPFVLASEPARPQHGGGGATYVLIRRLR